MRELTRYPEILKPDTAISADCNFDCSVCSPTFFGFQIHKNTGRLFKFPPALGSQKQAPFAFAGLNPRISDRNRRDLFDIVTPDRGAFVALAENRTPDGEPYVRLAGGERHYHTHAQIVREATRGTEIEGRFEDLAVCTELFMCATPPRRTAALCAALRDRSAVCPSLHFWKAIHRAAPKVVVTLGDDVFDYVSAFANWDQSVYRLNTPTAPVIVAIAHPGGPRRLSLRELGPVADACREVLLDRVPAAWDFRTSVSSAPSVEGAERERRFDWSENHGWQVAHQPSDYIWLQLDPQRLITYLLYKDDALRYKISVNEAQLRRAIKWPRWPRERYVNPVTKRKDHCYTELFLPQWAEYVTVCRKCGGIGEFALSNSSPEKAASRS